MRFTNSLILFIFTFHTIYDRSRSFCVTILAGAPSSVSHSHLSREALSVEEVLRTLVVLAPKVEAHLLQPVAVAQGAAGNVHQVGFVWPQRHVLPRVVHGASHLGRKHTHTTVTYNWQPSLLISMDSLTLSFAVGWWGGGTEGKGGAEVLLAKSKRRTGIITQQYIVFCPYNTTTLAKEKRKQLHICCIIVLFSSKCSGKSVWKNITAT